MIPALLGMLAGGAMMGFGAIQGMAPSAGNAISACLTGKITHAQQQSLQRLPNKELDPGVLTHARLRNLISHASYEKALKHHGIDTNRADVLMEASRNLLTLENLANSLWKGDINHDGYIKKAVSLGFKADEAELFLVSYRSIPSAENLIITFWRGDITKETFYQRMKAQGYDKTDADILISAQYFLPSHEDLIRFQVRDVYNEHIVEKYGYAEEFPENIVPDAKKIGMSRETMAKYWKAHWELPSPTQAYNMLQRLHPEVLDVLGDKYPEMGLSRSDIETDVNTIKELLKIADYPKYWRDRLVAISYDPITRVDLRRIYQLGLCSKKFVVATMREHGYSQKDAELIAVFYEGLKQGKDKQLTASALLKGYQYGYVLRSELWERLRAMNYTDRDIQILIDTQKAQLDEKDFKDLLSVWQAEYVAGTLTEDTIRMRLGQRGLASKKIDLIIAKMKQANRKTIKMPPLADLKAFYKKGLFDEAMFRQALSDFGIPNRFHDYYVTLNQPDTTEVMNES